MPFQSGARVHPEASRELGTWVKKPSRGRTPLLLLSGTARTPESSHEFVTWAILHPAAPIQAHAPGLALLDRIVGGHRPAANTFMAWCRHTTTPDALAPTELAT